MSRYSTDSGGGGGFKPEFGIHNVICCQLVDFGTTDKEWKGKIVGKVNKINIGFEFVDIELEGENGDKYHPVWGVQETNSLKSKANLRGLLEGWRGRAFSEEELKSFDLNVLLGLSCALVIGPNTNGNPKVTAISKCNAKLEGKRECNAFWIDEDWDRSVPEWLPEWMKEKVNECDEARGLTGKVGTAQQDTDVPADTDEYESDIPF